MRDKKQHNTAAVSKGALDLWFVFLFLQNCVVHFVYNISCLTKKRFSHGSDYKELGREEDGYCRILIKWYWHEIKPKKSRWLVLMACIKWWLNRQRFHSVFKCHYGLCSSCTLTWMMVSLSRAWGRYKRLAVLLLCLLVSRPGVHMCLFPSLSTQQIESHNTYVLINLRGNRAVMQLSRFGNQNNNRVTGAGEESLWNQLVFNPLSAVAGVIHFLPY